MLQNATDLDLTAFVGVGLGEGSWEAFCKNSIISRQIVETTAKDFAGTNPRHETVILEFAFYEYSGRVVYHLLKQNGLGRWWAKFRIGKFSSRNGGPNQFHLPQNGREGLKVVIKNAKMALKKWNSNFL